MYDYQLLKFKMLFKGNRNNMNIIKFIKSLTKLSSCRQPLSGAEILYFWEDHFDWFTIAVTSYCWNDKRIS